MIITVGSTTLRVENVDYIDLLDGDAYHFYIRVNLKSGAVRDISFSDRRTRDLYANDIINAMKQYEGGY